MCFTHEVVFNIHNSHIWMWDNPQTKEHEHQDHFSVDIWVGIIKDTVVGHYLLPDRLSEQCYYCWKLCYWGAWRCAFLWGSNSISITLYGRYLAVGKWHVMDVEGQLHGLLSCTTKSKGFFHVETPEGAHYTIPPTIIKDLVLRLWTAVTTVGASELWCAQENVLKCSAVCPETNGGHFEHLLQLLRHTLFDHLITCATWWTHVPQTKRLRISCNQELHHGIFVYDWNIKPH